jgi:HSP20 family protein
MAKTGTQMAPARGFRNLMTFDPWREMAELQRSINQLFNSGRAAGDDVALSAWTPAVDIFENESEYVLKLELPEINRDDVKINLHEQTLTISGERKIENEDKREGYHRIERSYGQFYRSFTLPPNVNVEAINAQFKDGILRLTLPKREEAKPKQIEVKIG